MRSKLLPLLLVVAAAGTAYADPDQGGLSISAGGGVVGFTDHAMRDVTSVGGAWNVRAEYGTHAVLAVEGAYTGTVQGVETPMQNATLVGNSLEIAARANIWSGAWQPFGFVGAGVARYTLSQSMSSAGMVAHDNVFEIPFGGGLAYRRGALVAEARATMRIVTGENLMALVPSGAAPMHNWGVAATIGRAF